MPNPFDLALFDIGGVLGMIDVDAVSQAASELGVDARPTFAYMRSAYAGDVRDDHPWCRAERGEIGFAELVELAEPDAPGISVVLDPSRGLMYTGMRPSPQWRDLARRARESGVRVAALTNTLEGLSIAATMRHRREEWSSMAEVFGDDVIESHRVGRRKPDPELFVQAVSRFGTDPASTLFVDDEVANCAGARAAGLTAIHHDDGDAARAEFRALLGLGATTD